MAAVFTGTSSSSTICNRLVTIHFRYEKSNDDNLNFKFQLIALCLDLRQTMRATECIKHYKGTLLTGCVM